MWFQPEQAKYEISSFDVAPFLHLNINDEKYDMKIAGDFNAYNALAAYSVLISLGQMNKQLKMALKRIHQTMVDAVNLKKNEKKR